LLLAVLGGTLLRLWPTLAPGSTQFIGDSAAMSRLVLTYADTGKEPAVDRLSEAPGGRALGAAYAPGLIVLAGTFERVMRSLGSRDANLNLSLFGALCGGLVAVPVFLWARLAWGSGWAAPFAALAIVLLPAHLHRTFGYSLRFEAVGSLFVTAHLAAFAAALAAASRRERVAWAAAAALLLVVALWTWRVPLFLPILEAAFVAGCVVWRGAGPELRDAFPPYVLLATCGLPALEYLRVQRFICSGSWLAVVAVAAVLALPRLAPGRARAWERAAWLAAALGLAIAVSRFTATSTTYAAVVTMLPLRLMGMLHLPVQASPLETLMLTVEELGPLPPAPLLVGAMNLAFLGPWLLLTPLVLWWLLGRPDAGRLGELRAQHVWLAVVSCTFVALTLLFYRSKVLLAPVVAEIVAGALQALLAPRAAAGDARPRPRTRGAQARNTPARPGAGARTLLAALLLACLAGDGVLSVVIARTRESRLDADFLACARFLRERTPGGATIATLWEQGYDVQTYARRPTLVDGFLESDVVRTRIQDMARAAWQPTPDSLARWCRTLGARYLLVSPSSHLLGVAILVGDPVVAKLRAARPITAAEADRTLIRMMVFGRDEPPFTRAFESGAWRVYALADSGVGRR
jgi:hypothetical protein